MAVRYKGKADGECDDLPKSSPPPSTMQQDNNHTGEPYVYYPTDDVLEIEIQIIRTRSLLRFIISHLVTHVLMSYTENAPLLLWIFYNFILFLALFYHCDI